MPQHVYRIRILCPHISIAEVVADFCQDLGYGTGFQRFDDTGDEDRFYADIFTHTPPDTHDMDVRMQTLSSAWDMAFSYDVSRISDTDWIRKNRENTAPLHIGDFFVYQSLYTGERPMHAHGILVRADQAFGTGSHDTTAGCLQAISDMRISKPTPKILDVGTGTGILAIGAYKKFAESNPCVWACDVDSKSVDIARDLSVKNGVDIQVLKSHGVQHDTLQKNVPYDVIIANILAYPLIHMAESFCAVLAPCGHIIISGFTTAQSPDVQRAYESFGCRVISSYIQNDWVSLVLVRS